MTNEIGTYSFLPWLRQGIANNIKTQDLDSSVKVRAAVNIALTLKGEGIDATEIETISRDVALYGPGDIIGIQSKAIIKTEPRDWITNFEPNYLPYIDFYDEDFSWRYTPAAPNTGRGRLRPWIMLVVLTEDEFEDGKNIANKPLPYIEVTDASNVFPPVDQLWAWAHVHINEDIVKLENDIENNDLNSVLPRFRDVLNRNPDLAHSRIVCPRKLAANTPHHAFLIPVFESGRLAGLGSEISPDTPATKSSWDSGQTEFPYYHRWYFRTGTVGDFEYLVRLLEPKPVDSRVGRRDMDVLDPGSNISGIDDKLGGVLKLGGALQVPFKTMPKADKAEVLKYENWDRLDQLEALSDEEMEELLGKDTVEKLDQVKPHIFQKDLASFINLADDYSVKEAAKANQDSALSEKIERTIPKSEFGDENLVLTLLNEGILKNVDIDHVRFDDSITNEDLLRSRLEQIEGIQIEPILAIWRYDDPLITPPLYGRWHAMVQRLLEERDGTSISPNNNWIHELNLDPRWRVAVDFGTKVVQDKQEEYMDAAWGQVGEILEANRKIRLAQLAKETSWVFYNKHITTIKEKNTEKALVFTAPVQKRILAQDATVYHQVNTSRVPHAIVSAPLRRIIRPRSRLMRSLPFADNIQPENLIYRINKEEVYPAPPKEVPKTVPTLDDLSDGLKPDNVPDLILDLLSKYPWLQYLPLALVAVLLMLVFILGFSGISLSVIGAMVAGSLYLYTLLKRWTRQVQDAESVLEENQTPEAVDELPNSPDFRITDMREGFTPGRGATDSPEASRFKTALRDTYEFVQLSGQAGAIPTLNELNVNLMVDETIKGINPELTIPRLVLNNIRIPAHIKKLIGEEFKEAMAYPEFDIPMYKPLVDISTELFLPNINYISQNSISLLETNQNFIESYMVGLNHEFARELLWREYPTDQRGSYFRQFWDVSGYLDTKNLDEEALKEKLRDIPLLHRWSKISNLGDHDYREEQGDKEEEAVLVIRGELLKKYPTAVIYAHKAEWQRKEDGTIDNTKERRLVELTDEELKNPPRDKVKTPLYEAKVDPDIYFFGFNITIEEARGGTGENPDDKPGWFFVIEERPGEPRFGLDIKREGDINVWNDLAWEDVVPSVDNGNFININATTPIISLVDPHCDPEDPLHNPELEEKCEQYMEDMHLTWNKDMNAAEVAYILYQVPVLVAVHASEMLPKKINQKGG